jgi:hypothetical protein
MDYFTYEKDCRGILVGFKKDKIDVISYLTGPLIILLLLEIGSVLSFDNLLESMGLLMQTINRFFL